MFESTRPIGHASGKAASFTLAHESLVHLEFYWTCPHAMCFPECVSRFRSARRMS